MKFERFDRSRLDIKSIKERKSDLDLSIMQNPKQKPQDFDNANMEALIKDIRKAKSNGAPVLILMGAHVIRSGASPWLIELMEKGWIDHIGLNGAGAIHDFEIAYMGKTTESVARYIKEGQFGLWKETGRINDLINEGVKLGMGYGQILGKAIEKEQLAHRRYSLLYAGYRLGIPVTVHVGIGNDIIHEHPNFDGCATGKATYDDFLIFTKSMEKLEKGIFLNIGTAVMGPEVYLKALAMVRNVAHQNNQSISHFTTAVFDVADLGQDIHTVPDKTNPKYYFRPWKTILARTVADGGKSYYIQGKHDTTIGYMSYQLLHGGNSNG